MQHTPIPGTKLIFQKMRSLTKPQVLSNAEFYPTYDFYGFFSCFKVLSFLLSMNICPLTSFAEMCSHDLLLHLR